MIELSNVSKNFMYRGAKVKVLNKICLKIEKGETVCLRGTFGNRQNNLAQYHRRNVSAIFRHRQCEWLRPDTHAPTFFVGIPAQSYWLYFSAV